MPNPTSRAIRCSTTTRSRKLCRPASVWLWARACCCSREIWQFVGCRQKNVSVKKIERDGICGDVWTWTAIDADTKLSKSVPCFMLGQREPIAARDFLEVLAGRLANRVQLTSDGLKAYLTAVKSALETISTLPNW
jgi:hypothetical protein